MKYCSQCGSTVELRIPEGDNLPSSAHACWRKGNALEQLGRSRDAREAYEESLRREPGLQLAKKALDDLKE